MTLKKKIIHSTLFIATVFTTSVAGVAWLNRDPFDLYNFPAGLEYAALILFILTCHEFGHYFAARYHGVEATLPYYIPSPSLPGLLNFGTFGAVIRTKSSIPSKKVMFDIGVAGPIAGFIATLGVLTYGFTHLPGKEFILTIHPDYFTAPSEGVGLQFGPSLLYNAMSALLTDPLRDFVPPMSEMYHYPFLCTGWFGLFVTAMNLIPIGQLDGGHLSYAMFGDRHKAVSHVAFAGLLLFGLLGLLPAWGIDTTYGWSGWIFWAIVLLFIVKLYHPPVEDESPLDPARRIID
jgi:membrane-associated protease RseP (regulator of RpoE activity)